MDDGGNPYIGLTILLVLVVLHGLFFSLLAVMNLINENNLEKAAKDNNKKASLLLKFYEKPISSIHTIQFILTGINLLAGICIANFSTGITKISFFLLLWFVMLLFGIYIPSKMIIKKADKWAGLCEEEIISMVNEGHEQGVLLASEAEMIHNIFEFGEKEAKDIMTHRKNIHALDGNMTFQDAMKFMTESSNSRFPVYLEDIDNIIGVLHIKEALQISAQQEYFNMPIKEIQNLVRKIDFIPETRNINTLFKEMQSEKTHMVIVVDEYGQTAGIVAMEDILEEIVGNILDEHDEDEVMIQQQADGSYIIHGMTEFEDVAKVLKLSINEEDDYETLNGFLISKMDKIPNENDRIVLRIYEYDFKILAVENKIIQKVLVTKTIETKEDDRETDSSCQDS